MNKVATGIVMVLVLAAGARAQVTVSYNTSGNWSDKDPQPTSADTVIINNNAVIELDVDGEADILRIANQATGESGTLNIASNHTLTVARWIQFGTQAGPGYLNQSNGTLTAQQFSINHNSAGALSEYHLSGGSATATTRVTVNNQGLLDISGGTLTTPELIANGTVTIDGGTIARDIEGVGAAGATIAGTGKIELLSGSYALTGGAATDRIHLKADLIEVSGGTLNWEGHVTGGGTNGVFRVIGDEATISMGRLNSQTAGTEHTLDFVFGETGISTINVDGFVHLSGATIHIDGSAYTGEAGTFDLISTPNLASESTSITLTGFDAFEDAFVTQDTTDNLFTLHVGSAPDPFPISSLDVDLYEGYSVATVVFDSTGLSYTLQYRTNLTEGVWLDGPTGEASPLSFTNEAASLFFRVQAE